MPFNETLPRTVQSLPLHLNANSLQQSQKHSPFLVTRIRRLQFTGVYSVMSPHNIYILCFRSCCQSWVNMGSLHFCGLPACHHRAVASTHIVVSSCCPFSIHWYVMWTSDLPLNPQPPGSCVSLAQWSIDLEESVLFTNLQLCHNIINFIYLNLFKKKKV